MSPAFVDNDGQLNWRKIAYHARSAFAVVLALTILIGGGWFAYYKVKETWVAMRSENDYVGEGKDEVIVSIPEGVDITRIGDILVEHGVIKSTRKFRDVCARTPAAATLQAGRFRLRTEMSAEAALALLLDADSKVALTVTLPEGRATAQQWSILMNDLGLKEEDLQAAAESSELGLPSWSGGTVDGFLFPDTYQVAEPATALGVLKQQVEQFNKVAGSLNLESKAVERNLTPYEILIVASLVEKEAGRPEDRAMIARIIYNRLAIDKELEFDSTVHYAVGDFSRVTTTEEDRLTDSPYNTYKYKGLPPTPISNPGQAALEAALSPAEHNYVYFTTVDLDTGETRYSEDWEGHKANVTLFEQWCNSHPGRCT
ncbi:MAG: endolytic transglycosylase MltG [Propionibacteriaceae bacterium]|nr:endolytic transglycosylase MltG [Propionibacteriaceae bacterium]